MVRMAALARLGAGLGALGALSAVASDAQAPPAASGEVAISIRGESDQLIGHQNERTAATAGGSETVRQVETAFTVSGHGPTRYSETLQIKVDEQGAPQSWQWRRSIDDRVLTVDLERAGALFKGVAVGGGERHAVSAAIPALPIGDPDALAPLMSEPAAPRSWSIAEFDPVALQFRPVQLALAKRTGADHAADHAYVLTLSRAGRLQSVRWLVYEQGRLVEARQPLLGSARSYRRDDGPLTKEDVLSRGRVVAHEQYRPNVHMTQRAALGQIRYDFGAPADVAVVLPETGEQRVRREGDGWQVDICRDCGPALPPTETDRRQWTRPSQWIQSDDAGFREKAAQARRGAKTDEAVMDRLAVAARVRLPRIDFDGYVSARTAWRRRAGDCTEDALVLTALGRAAGIPARVVHGLVFSPGRYHGASNAFMPHSWVIAFVDGRWKSFDISLNGFDATHIALSLGDGEPEAMVEANQIAALLDWRAIAEVRKRPVDP